MPRQAARQLGCIYALDVRCVFVVHGVAWPARTEATGWSGAEPARRITRLYQQPEIDLLNDAVCRRLQARAIVSSSDVRSASPPTVLTIEIKIWTALAFSAQLLDSCSLLSLFFSVRDVATVVYVRGAPRTRFPMADDHQCYINAQLRLRYLL